MDNALNFIQDTVAVQGGTLFYAKAGQGKKTLLFVHGFSQDWSSFIKIMQLCAPEYTVVAIDLPGIGRSTNQRKRYDSQSLAKMINEFCEALSITNPYIVGHDMGGMVVYTYARLYEGATAGIALLDAPLPGTPDTDLMVKLPFLWHFAFHRLPRVPERLIHNHVAGYFKKAFFNRFTRNKTALSHEDMKRYAAAYKTSDQLAAGLELYRAYKKDRAFMRSNRAEFNTPILIVESDFGSKGPGPVAGQLKNLFNCQNVNAVMIKDCGHYIPEENPEKLYELIHSAAGKLPV